MCFVWPQVDSNKKSRKPCLTEKMNVRRQGIRYSFLLASSVLARW